MNNKWIFDQKRNIGMKWKYHSLLSNISPPVRHNILLRIREMGGISWEISRKQIIFIFGNKFQDFPASLQAKFLCWLSWYPNIFFQTCKKVIYWRNQCCFLMRLYFFLCPIAVINGWWKEIWTKTTFAEFSPGLSLSAKKMEGFSFIAR